MPRRIRGGGPPSIPLRKHEHRQPQPWGWQVCSGGGPPTLAADTNRRQDRLGRLGGILITASLPPGQETPARPCSFDNAIEV